MVLCPSLPIPAVCYITQQNYVTYSYFRWHNFQDSLPSGEVHSKYMLSLRTRYYTQLKINPFLYRWFLFSHSIISTSRLYRAKFLRKKHATFQARLRTTNFLADIVFNPFPITCGLKLLKTYVQGYRQIFSTFQGIRSVKQEFSNGKWY
jgi:hypothetical protein